MVIEEAGGYDSPDEYADEFNDYFYNQLGVHVDSVESIFFKFFAKFFKTKKNPKIFFCRPKIF